MAKAAESVTLDDDEQEELRKLAERSGRPLGVVANAALRDYVHYENQVGVSIERGLADVEAGRVRERTLSRGISAMRIRDRLTSQPEPSLPRHASDHTVLRNHPVSQKDEGHMTNFWIKRSLITILCAGLAGAFPRRADAEINGAAIRSASAQGLEANVIAVSIKAGNPFLDVVVAIPKGIDDAARDDNADFGLLVTVTYVAQSGDVVTLDSGRLSIGLDTTFVSNMDNQTVGISLQLQLGTALPAMKRASSRAPEDPSRRSAA